ncbi:MAG: ATP-dependent zinc metalloprotease FtsH [Sandaracinaceae bacterium]|nr:ATP-dependent zinc metalloprotease FtsH [Sandaracinaceae bacterium]
MKIEQRHALTLTALMLVLFFFWAMRITALRESAPRTVSWSEFVNAIDAGQTTEVIVAEHALIARLREEKPGERPRRIMAVRLPEIDEGKLIELMQERGVSIRGEIERTEWWESLLFGWIIPIGILIGFWWLLLRRMGRGGPLSFGRSHAKIYDRNRDQVVTFDDVAGIDEAKAELMEVVSFLKNPQAYQALGARPPKGVLLVGPPGTGKTLLARAVAGEAGVPFFAISGSEFVQMFVGVGAARVRDLFEQAKERAPCIVFIDELDAIGRSRAGIGAGSMAHEEREQTLNQLLVEMDGFDASSGVVILAATNRPEILDPALLRAGRFDRQVVVDRPDVRGRKAILEVHARKIKLGPDVDLELIAKRTPGMAGADLANVVNEAAIAATRRGASQVEARDFEEAVDRIQLGLKKQGRVMSPAERKRIAYHEAGHALVALNLKHADPVHRITIIPRSIGALGATLQLPTEDRNMLTQAELEDRIAVMLGGRAAEEIAFGDASTGAQNDLERATEIARAMVTRFGMGKSLGLMTGAPPQLQFLEVPELAPKVLSEESLHAVELEIRSILERGCERALSILRANRNLLERLVNALLDKETIDRQEIELILNEKAESASVIIPAS